MIDRAGIGSASIAYPRASDPRGSALQVANSKSRENKAGAPRYAPENEKKKKKVKAQLVEEEPNRTLPLRDSEVIYLFDPFHPQR